VTKRVSAYANENNLKHPENGRVIVLDDKLKALLSPPEGQEITFMNIQKYLSPHYIKEEKAAPAAKKPKIEKEPAAKAEPASASTDAPAAAKRPVVKRKAPTA
jgi:chromatin remodeling complex protein RSC6